MNFDNDIPDFRHYLNEMAKPLMDKLFFIDKVEANVFVDYGCADGVLLHALKPVLPDSELIGFDVNPHMIANARSRTDCHVLFTDDWNRVHERLLVAKKEGQKTCVILSSIIHEIYAYLNPMEIEEFWNRIWGNEFELGFDTVCIRDMMVNRSTSRQSDILAVSRIRQIYDISKLAEWELHWGTLNENWSLVHFLLTYRYTENWNRELKENYLPLALEVFLNKVPARYSAIYMEHFVPPFLRKVVRKDFKIDLPDPTHLKIILERQ